METQYTVVFQISPFDQSRSLTAFISLRTVSATLVVLPMLSFSFAKIYFLPTEWILYLSVSPHVSQLFLPHHTYPLPMQVLLLVLKIHCHFPFVSSFQKLQLKVDSRHHAPAYLPSIKPSSTNGTVHGVVPEWIWTFWENI